MKKLLVLTISVMFLTSCGGGWSDEDKDKFMTECPFESEEKCECLLDATMDRWSSWDALNKEKEEYEKMDKAEKREFREEMNEWEDDVEDKCSGL